MREPHIDKKLKSLHYLRGVLEIDKDRKRACNGKAFYKEV